MQAILQPEAMQGADGGPPVDEPEDDRLRQLLAVEQRLQDFVRAAKEDAVRRITAARGAREHRLTAAREAAQRDDAERARMERAVHDEALSAIETAHQAALAAIAGLSDTRVDELARRALVQAIGGTGEPA